MGFVILFILTAGKLKFWIFPNLTEDVGFFESFVPVYVYTYDKPKKDKDSDDEESSEEKEELSKAQKSVVNWLRKNVPTKKTKFEHSHVVEYFSAAKALDALMTSSPWAPEKAKADAELRFEFREQAIDYMGELMRLHMFHRARKVPVAEK